MRRALKIGFAVGAIGLGFLAYALARPLAPTSLGSATVWIADSLDSDRAVNALPERDSVQTGDPAKAYMATAAASQPNIAKDVDRPAATAASDSPTSILPPAPPVPNNSVAAAAAPTEKAIAATAFEEPQPRFDLAQAIVPPVLPNKVAPPSPVLPRVQAPPSAGGSNAAPAPSVAGTAPVNAAAPAPIAAASVVTGTSCRDISVEINRGALIKLPVAADTVFVANPDIADIQVKSPRLLYLYGKRAGETVIYAVDGDDNVLLNSRVKITHNLGAFRTAIRSAAPDAGLDVSTVGDALVITGDINSPAQAEDVRRIAARFAPGEGAVVNQMRVLQPNQINLRVRIAEVSRDTLKQFGINWDAAFKMGGFIFGLASGNPVTAGDFVIGGLDKVFNVRNNGTNSIVGSYNKGNFDINGLIDARANENLITVLAEPNLTAMSGETANFLAGGEFPVPVAQSGSAAGAITVEFKKFGVGLAFTPTVLENGRVNLKVRPEVSQLSSVGGVQVSNYTVPALTTRRAETTVELSSGQSFAIAGLLQNNSTQDASKVPFLGDVPILGALFKSDRYKRNETELVIVVTPYLVRPVSANAIALPTDGFVPPTDGQRILYGSTNRQDMPQGAPIMRGRDGNALVGPSGFQLD